MPETLSLTNPADVVSAIPALLGFNPTDSLVVLVLNPDRGRLVCIMRIDLDTPAAELTRQLIDAATRLEPVKLLTVAYPTSLAAWIDSTEEQSLRTVLEDVQAAGIDLKDVLVVTEGRWWSQMCTDPDCCPAAGTPIAEQTTVLEALRVRNGLPAVAVSRQEIAARYTLREPFTDALLEQCLPDAEQPLPSRKQLALQLLDDLAANWQADAAAKLAWLLQDVVGSSVPGGCASRDRPRPRRT